MMPFNLPRLARAAGKRRNLTLRPIIPTDAQATDLAAVIAPAWRIWAENIDRIMAGYDPAPLPVADALVLDSPDQITAAIESVANEFLTRLVTTITPGLRAWVVRMERWHRDKFAAGIAADVGVDVSMMLGPSDMNDTLDVFMARNVALIRNVSDQIQAKVSDAVFRGYQNRAPIREVAKEVRETTGLGRDRSRRIAQDQTQKISAALDRGRQQDAGITQFRWRHSAKLHPRKEHQVRDGKVYDWSSEIARTDPPGAAPFCGCRAQAYIALLDEIE